MIFFPTWNHQSQNANHVICYGPKLLQFLCNATEQLMNIIHISTCTKGELDGEIRTAPYHVILMEESVLPVASSDTIFCRMAGSCLWLGLPPKPVSVALQCMCANVCGPYGAISSLVLVFTSLSLSMTSSALMFWLGDGRLGFPVLFHTCLFLVGFLLIFSFKSLLSMFSLFLLSVFSLSFLGLSRLFPCLLFFVSVFLFLLEAFLSSLSSLGSV